jgi:AcrR family transcriptional regulator
MARSALRPPARPARPASPHVAKARTRARRLERSAATREAILAAALDEFAARGFAAARLDDVARRAGVAKGTIYVHFRDKVTLFEELVRSALGPVIAAAESASMADMPLRPFAERLIDTFVREIYGTHRKHVLRLIITEGERFPQLAHIYYREVIARALKVLRTVVQRAVERGEVDDDALLRFPQLLIAPGLVAVIWDALFARFEPLDVPAMMRKHLELLFEALERRRT